MCCTNCILLYSRLKCTSLSGVVLQKHYRQLEAIALEKDTVDDVADLTESDSDLIHKRVGTLLDEFKEIGGLNDSKGRKRKVGE